MEKEVKRIDWIDTAKGIGILLVVIGHVSRNQEIQNFIYSFHMPLFFMISGFLYKHKENFKKNKFKRLIVPYFLFSILWFFYWVLVEKNVRGQDNVSVFGQFINIFLCRGGEENYVYNAVMWFLPCLFVTEIIFDFINTKIKGKLNIYVPVIILFSSFFGYLYPKITTFRLPLCLDIVFTSIVFYYIGYIFKLKEEWISKKVNNKYKKLIISLVAFIIVGVLSQKEQGMNFNNLIFNSYYLLYITAIIGGMGIYFISNVIKLKILNLLSLNSLLIMCIHEPIKRVLMMVFSKVTKISLEIIINDFLLILIFSIMTLCVSLIVIKFFEFIKNHLARRKRLEI